VAAVVVMMSDVRVVQAVAEARAVTRVVLLSRVREITEELVEQVVGFMQAQAVVGLAVSESTAVLPVQRRREMEVKE
jgi:hypothetical protein